MELQLLHIYDVTPEFNLQLKNPVWESRYADVELYAVQRDYKGYHVFRIIKDLSDDESEILYFAETLTIAKHNIKTNKNKLSFSDIFVYDLSNGLHTDKSESYKTLEEALGFITDNDRYPMKRRR